MTEYSLSIDVQLNEKVLGAVHKLCYAEGGRGVWPSVTIGIFSYLSESKFLPKVFHGGGGGASKIANFGVT